jgi:hypothetical protein
VANATQPSRPEVFLHLRFVFDRHRLLAKHRLFRALLLLLGLLFVSASILSTSTLSTSTLSTSTAAAQASPEPATSAPDLQGTCHPGVVQPGQPVTCTFEVGPAGVAPVVGVVSDGPDAVTTWCSVADQDNLAIATCPLIQPGTRAGTRSIDVNLGDEVLRNAARFDVDTTQRRYSLALPRGQVPVALVGSELNLGIEIDETIGSANDLLWITTSPATNIDDSLSSSQPIPNTDGDIVLKVSDDAGLYRLSLCEGASEATCEFQPGSWLIQVIDSKLEPLVPAANLADANRINVIVASSDYIPATLLTDLLGLNGPIAINARGERATSRDDVTDVILGPFAIEPLASSVHRFNIWLIGVDIVDPSASIPDGFALPNVHVLTLHWMTPGDSRRSSSTGPSFAGQQDMSDSSAVRFGDSYVALAAATPLLSSTTIAHEWGHALFDLRDEYGGNDPGPTEGYPNCAPDEATALAWWGPAIGSVDPFYEEYLAALATHGLAPTADLLDQLTISLTPGLCLGSRNSTAVRPSGDSLMNSHVPVFGWVNRFRAQQVLDRWSGQAPFTDLRHLKLSCEPNLSPTTSPSCTGTIAAQVAAPETPIDLLSADGSVVAECVVAGGAPAQGWAVTCGSLPRGPSHEGLVVSYGDDIAPIATLGVAAPKSLSAAATQPDGLDRTTVALGAGLLVALAGTAFAGAGVMRQRRLRHSGSGQ